MTNKIFKNIVLCTVMLFLLTGCSNYNGKSEIVIGVAWPFAANNRLFNEGIDLAVQEINSAGGIQGRKLILDKKDDGSDIEKGMAIAQSFADNEKIQAVIGHSSSFVSIPVSSIYENAGLVMLSPSSTAPELTENGYKRIFRNIPSDDDIAQQLAIHLFKEGHRRMVIYYSNDAYGTGLAGSFEDHAREQGIAIVDRFDYYSGLKNLKRLHNRWKAFGFDGIFIANTVEEGSQLISDAHQAGIDVLFVAGNTLYSPSLPKTVGNTAEGTIVGSVFDPGSPRPEVKSFVSSFSKKYHQLPSSYAALGYDAV